MSEQRPDIQKVMSGLKDFQRRTVEHAFHQLYGMENATGRFLVADEVGLGKTLVARGLVAKVVDYLWDVVGRIDVIYICSNGDIARQNIQRLHLGGGFRPALPTRVTMLPVTISNLRNSKLNFVSLTPGTSFDLKSTLGTKDERALLYIMLSEAWGLKGRRMRKLMRGDAGLESFEECIEYYRGKDFDPDLKASFIQAANQETWELTDGTTVSLKDAFEVLIASFRPNRDDTKRQRNTMIGHLRQMLAITCLQSLEPDFIILDEFQRFKHLFDDDNESGMLAKHLFDYASDSAPSSRLLLLSATPYKMYSLHNESTDENHYKDFIDTIRFLLRDSQKTEDLEQNLRSFRDEVFRLGTDAPSMRRLRGYKQQMESCLKSVMSRTERLSISEDRNGMLTQVTGENLELKPEDLRHYLTMQSVAESLESGDVLEYWKAAPYLLNFMDSYQLKNALVGATVENSSKASSVSTALRKHPQSLWPNEPWRQFEPIDPQNPRLRRLLHDMVDNDAWRLLWLPPTLPYYQPAGVFRDPSLQKLTKRLIFSSWRVVPKAVASIVSYEVERRMVKSFDSRAENSLEARRRRRGLLNFAVSEGRLTGMPIISLMYPSTTLAQRFDPLSISAEEMRDGDGGAPQVLSAEALVRVVQQRIDVMLDDVFGPETYIEGVADESWYWAAPVLMDLHFDHEGTIDWWERGDLAQRWESGAAAGDADAEGNTRWPEHVNQVRALLHGEQRLRKRPGDLARTLALVAIAGPGVAALRSLGRAFSSGTKVDNKGVRDAAAKIGWSFRNLFNIPEYVLMIRGLNGEEEPYWLRVLEYCIDGCLQAVLDEYTHCVFEARSLDSLPREDGLDQAVEAIRSALSLRTTRITADDIQIDDTRMTIRKNDIGLRARFAQRFGDEQADGIGSTKLRATQVRDAFNSPFWPFVLVTTSIGQEGLDFHTYCHSVMHWDLPSNPVDLEQREGRVHRYKGHAIRKNVALKYGMDVLRSTVMSAESQHPFPVSKSTSVSERSMVDWTVDAPVDPWKHVFELALQGRPAGESDLVPYWVFPVEGGAQIERHVPALPMSRDLNKLSSLRRTLAVYRMVFGQPRQDDLIEYLLRIYGPKEVRDMVDMLTIDLSPQVVTSGVVPVLRMDANSQSEEVETDVETMKVRNPIVSRILEKVVKEGMVLNPHPGNPQLVNVFSPSRGKNVIGDLGVMSEKGSFRLERSDGQWASFRTFGWRTDDPDFESKVLRHIGVENFDAGETGVNV